MLYFRKKRLILTWLTRKAHFFVDSLKTILRYHFYKYLISRSKHKERSKIRRVVNGKSSVLMNRMFIYDVKRWKYRVLKAIHTIIFIFNRVSGAAQMLSVTLQWLVVVVGWLIVEDVKWQTLLVLTLRLWWSEARRRELRQHCDSRFKWKWT